MRRIFHIHIPQTGGTWLSHNLHRCFTDGSSWIRSPHGHVTDHGSIPREVVEWEHHWKPPPEMSVSPEGLVRNAYVGDIGHRTVSGLSSGGEDDPRFIKHPPHPGQYGRDGTRWWNPKSGIGGEAVSKMFNQSFKVSVCRNPFELIHSRWKKTLRQDGQTWPLTEFVERYFDPAKPQVRETWRKDLYEQMYHDDGNCGVQFVIRNEFLYDGLLVLMDHLGQCPQERSRERVEKDSRFRDEDHKEVEVANGRRPIAKWVTQERADYREHYTPEARKIVKEYCDFELRAFGYDFNGRTESVVGDDCDCELAKKHDNLFAHVCLKK